MAFDQSFNWQVFCVGDTSEYAQVQFWGVVGLYRTHIDPLLLIFESLDDIKNFVARIDQQHVNHITIPPNSTTM